MGAYFATIEMLSLLGGYNDWVRALVFEQKHLFFYMVGMAEIRHFAFLPGPKFTIFYNTFISYELQQLTLQWQDKVEIMQKEFAQPIKQQLDYKRIHDEYRFIKKRAMLNFLVNQRLNLEKHFHNRTIAMLESIANQEQRQLQSFKQIAVDSFNETLTHLRENPEETHKRSFQQALEGIRKGEMNYSNDIVMENLMKTFKEKTAKLKNLTPEEEGKLLSLTAEQRESISSQDRIAKNEYLKSA